MPSGPRPDPPNLRCPACSSRAFEVRAITVRGLVRRELAGVVSASVYLYCPSPSCPVVYATAESSFRTFLRDDLRVRIGDKESQPPVTVCYCFDWTDQDIELEVTATGDTTIPDRIREKIQNGLCQCETMNPRGICCLGTVNRVAEGARARANGNKIP